MTADAERIKAIKARLDRLDAELEAWKSRKAGVHPEDDGSLTLSTRSRSDGLLTAENIDFLRVLAEKNFFQRKLTGAQRQMKSQMMKRMVAAMDDLEMMARLGFVGPMTDWEPSGINLAFEEYRRLGDARKLRLPFKADDWREVFPAGTLSTFVETMVAMFGDEYAVPLARAIERGLSKRATEENNDVQVSVVRRARY